MKILNTVVIGIIVIGVFILSLSIFIINEGSNGLILRLGKIVTDSQTNQPKVLQPGLYFKIPVIDRVKILDERIQELSSSSNKPLTVVTKEQTYLEIEYFAKWKISNPTKFYTSTGGGNITWAETLLEQRLNDIVRAEYGKRTSYQAISADRNKMMATIKEEADSIGKEMGVNVIDVRVQQITLPKDVLGSVFKRMEVERKQYAEAKRAEGMEKSEEIKALADQKVTVIKAEAQKQAATIRASGEFEAANIYAKVYSLDPKFYSFYRSLEAYQSSFNLKKDILILKPNGQFFNYFHTAKGDTATAAQ